MACVSRPQTALEGVATATGLNFISKLLNYARHVLITAFLGLSIQLDAFFIATSVVALCVNTFGDVFDSAGIPTLVRTREREGEEAFRDLTGSIFAFALRLGAGLTVLMVLLSPLAPLLVPGFPKDGRGYIYLNLLLLVPYAVVYLPFHGLGSFFRATREFRVFYLAELLLQATALLVIYEFGRSAWAVPASLSAGYLLAFLFFLAKGRGRFRFRAGKTEGMVEVRGIFFRMLPVYAVLYLLTVIDRYFASFLPTGAISALFYGYILAATVPMVMNVENIFITSLSEDSDRGALLSRILAGIWIVSLPVTLFSVMYAGDLVRCFFERGAFTPEHSAMTGGALRFYALGIPALFLWPVCYRTLQICGRFRGILLLAAAMVGLNAGLNYLFVFHLGMGVRGIALATSMALLFLALSALFLVRGSGIRVRFEDLIGVVPSTAVAAGVAAGGAAILPLAACGKFDVIPRGVVFLVVYGVVAFALPGEGMRRVWRQVRESFPLRRSRCGGPE